MIIRFDIEGKELILRIIDKGIKYGFCVFEFNFGFFNKLIWKL